MLLFFVLFSCTIDNRMLMGGKIRMQIFVRDKKFYATLVAFALPIALQQLITVGVNMADNIMLGQLGEAPMSGATLANNFITIFQIMCMGLGMGASVLVSRFFGMKEKQNMKKSVNIMFRLLIVSLPRVLCEEAEIPNSSWLQILSFCGFAAYHLELSPDLYLSGRDSMYI